MPLRISLRSTVARTEVRTLDCLVWCFWRVFFTDVPRIGLLVAACVNRAPPGTFGAAVAEVGVLDMLKVL